MAAQLPDSPVGGRPAVGGRVDDPLEVGTRIPLEGVSIAALMGQTSRPVRVDSFSQASGAIAEEARALGIRSSIGCPIVVGGSGLIGLRDGVEALGGSIQITSPAGEGTMIAVELPLRASLT